MKRYCFLSAVALLVGYSSMPKGYEGTDIAHAEIVICEWKTITVDHGRVVKIHHEDGTVVEGTNVAENWLYDGKSLKHRLIDDKTTCGTKPKSRDEIIKKLSSRFLENPAAYGMGMDDGRWISIYTENLMKRDEDCYLLVDAAKSSRRDDAFFIDCNDQFGKPFRFWVTKDDLNTGQIPAPVSPSLVTQEFEICDSELKERMFHPPSYKSSLPLRDSGRTMKSIGRNMVEIDFSVDIGIENGGKYRGTCIFESGHLIDSSIEFRS